MAPVLNALHAISRQAVPYVGGNDSALSWNTVLAFGAVMAAAMQGTLGMESADPCRLSYKKYKLLLTLEAVEIVIVVASEVVSFVELRNALKERLQWLHWLPPCLLTIGFVELIADVWWTCTLACWSRLEWLPLSSVGWQQKGRYALFSTLIEVVPLCLTAVLSLVLIGWRMRWWWVAVAVDNVVAEKALLQSRALSVGAVGFCVGWGLLLSAFVIACFVGSIIHACPGNYFEPVLRAMSPRTYAAKFSDVKTMSRKATPENVEKFRKLFEGEYGRSSPHTDDQITQFLEEGPLHVGNAIVSSDRKLVFREDGGAARIIHLLVLFVEHFTILPLQCCVVAAVAQLYSNLDAPAHAALKEVVDAVIIVALVELAIGFKSFLWGYTRVDELHANDRTSSDLPGGEDVRGILRRCF